MVQWLGLHALTAEDPGSIPGQGTKIPKAVKLKEKKDRATETVKIESQKENQTEKRAAEARHLQERQV